MKVHYRLDFVSKFDMKESLLWVTIFNTESGMTMIEEIRVGIQEKSIEKRRSKGMRLSKEQKEIIEKMIRDGWRNISYIAKKANCSRCAVKKYFKNIER